MTDKQKIKFQQEIIDKLENEILNLKQQLESKTIDVSDTSYKNEYDMKIELQAAIDEYNKLSDETARLNMEYKSLIEGIKNIRTKYEKDLENFVKNLK